MYVRRPAVLYIVVLGRIVMAIEVPLTANGHRDGTVTAPEEGGLASQGWPGSFTLCHGRLLGLKSEAGDTEDGGKRAGLGRDQPWLCHCWPRWRRHRTRLVKGLKTALGFRLVCTS